jgi:cytosine deaminase
MHGSPTTRQSRSTSVSPAAGSRRSNTTCAPTPRCSTPVGKLTCAGLVETHIHLDKSRIIERCAPPLGREVNPVKTVAPLKSAFTVEDVRQRAEATLCAAILHGTTRMRTLVEVDPGIGMRGFDGVQSLIADYRWAIDIEICVFPQEGLTNYPGTDELLVEALRRGAKVIGGAPRYDSDPKRQISRIFELAREYDVDIDIHLDVGPSAENMNIHDVIALTETYRRGGRVVVGHMAKLSLLPPDRLAAMARRLADAGIAVTVLPATDLYLMGRDQDHAVRRGVADANFLLEYGVNCYAGREGGPSRLGRSRLSRALARKWPRGLRGTRDHLLRRHRPHRA